MSDIDHTINTLRDQVQELEMELANLREANNEWHELMNDHEVDEIKDLTRFARDYDIDTVKSFLDNNDIDELDRVLSNYDLDDLEAAYDKIENYGEPQELAERVEELEECERKIEEYGDPQQTAEELEELREKLEEADAAETFGENDTDPVDHADIANDLINARNDLAECQNMLTVVTDERDELNRLYDNVEGERTHQDAYIVQLKTEIAQLDANCIRLSDELEKVYVNTPYMALYNSASSELDDLKRAYARLAQLYFSEVSGYDDVPSSAPDLTEGDCTGPGFTE